MGVAITSNAPPSGPGKIGALRLIVVQVFANGSYSYIVVEALESSQRRNFPVAGSTVKTDPAPACGICIAFGAGAIVVIVPALSYL